jgi:3-deoxy-D-manno-octulosonate 8-phosphate phosphatase (KDO 8-P phosphatase)
MTPSQNVVRRAARIQLLVFDVDGVMTDGGLYYGHDGEAFKRFDVKDGHGLVLARLTGLPAAILTARTSSIVAKRGKELGLIRVFQGKKHKGPAFEALCREVGVAPGVTAYMGDDVSDLPAMKQAGLCACPQDARPEVLGAAHFVAQAKGGFGAVREFTEAAATRRLRPLRVNVEFSAPPRSPPLRVSPSAPLPAGLSR